MIARKRQGSKRLGLGLGLALVAVLALSAIAAAGPASAATQHWYAGGSKLAQGVPTEVTGKAAGTFIFKWDFSGVEVEISCSEMSTAGTVENPSGGGAGTLSGGSLELKKCNVQKPSCVVKNQEISFNTLKGQLTEQSGKPAIKYEPASGTTFFSLTLEKCAIAATYNVKGSLAAFLPEENSNFYTFNQQSTALTIGGTPADLIGIYTLSTLGEEEVSVAGKALSISSGHWFAGGVELGQGASTPFVTAGGSMSFNLASTPFGANVNISCTGSLNKLEGTIENPTGGGVGTATGTLTLGGCSVTQPLNCIIEPGGKTPLQSNKLSGVVTEAEGKQAVKFSPAEGTVIAKVTLSGEKCTTPGTFNVKGSLVVTSGGGKFTISPSSSLTLGGSAATVSGQLTLEL